MHLWNLVATPVTPQVSIFSISEMMAINFFYNFSRIVRWIFKRYGSLNKNTLIFQTNTVWGSFCSLVSLLRTILLTMLLIASITFYYHYNILGFVWSTGYTYSSCFYHHQIGSINLITFFRSCVPEMFVTSYSVTYCIYIPGKPGFRFDYYYAVYDECK